MVMIYINFVELYSSMLHAEFQNHRHSGSEQEDFYFFFFAIYSNGSHIGFVTLTSFPLPSHAPHKVWL